MTSIPVLPDKNRRGYPKHQKGGRVAYVELGAALVAIYDTDAHFAAYSAPAIERRLTQDAIQLRDEIPDGIPLVAVVFDVDCESSHKASSAKTPMPATDEWWISEQPKVDALLEQHPGAFVYRTRGGYRIVYVLAVAVVLRDEPDACAWTERYVAWIAYLRRAFRIYADVGCADWTRLYRLPFVMRDGRRELRETRGNARAIGAWSCEPASEDFALARTLKKQKKPRANKASAEERPAASVGEGVLFHAFKARNWIGQMVEQGTWAVRCPWESDHTKGERFDTSTVLFAPGSGEELGWPHCSHSHCASRGIGQWLGLFTAEELDAARAGAGLPPRKSADDGEESNAWTVDTNTPGDLPVIVLGVDEHRVADEAIVALARLPGLYQRGGGLVDVVHVDGRMVIRNLPQPRIRELLTSAAQWVTERTNSTTGEIEQHPAHPPEWCVRAVMSRGAWEGIPRLSGLLQAPALRPDGSVIQDPGLDDSTGFLFLPNVDFPRVPERPTHTDALRARDELLEIVRDFPFATDAHRAAWLAFALTPFARPAFDGCVPLTAVDATTRGTGKGRIVDATASLATGRDASKAPQPKDDDEMRKRISSVLLEGEVIQVIDNVSRRVEDASLDACVTATIWKDRKLGKLETLALPNLTLWVITGNNLEFGADTARRTLHIRLESRLENPEDRDDFHHADLLEWVRTERPRLVCAALTLLRAYVVAGRPEGACRPWGSFEAWSRLIAHAVVWVGMPDPQSTRVELESGSDTRKSALVAILAGWERLAPYGVTARGAIEALYSPERLKGHAPPDGFGDLREAIEALVPTQPGRQPSAAKLGYQLRHFKRRVVGGRMLDSIEDRTGVAKWRVVAAKCADAHSEGAGDGGDEGDVSNPSREEVGDHSHVCARAHARMRRSGEHHPHLQHHLQSVVTGDERPALPGTEDDDPAPFSSWLAEKGVA